LSPISGQTEKVATDASLPRSNVGPGKNKSASVAQVSEQGSGKAVKAAPNNGTKTIANRALEACSHIAVTICMPPCLQKVSSKPSIDTAVMSAVRPGPEHDLFISKGSSYSFLAKIKAIPERPFAALSNEVEEETTSTCTPREEETASLDTFVVQSADSEPLRLSGLPNSWSLTTEGLCFIPDSSHGTARQRLCVKLTSNSFSFQVISAVQLWDWRLFPRDAVLQYQHFGVHASTEGQLKCDDKDAVAVAHCGRVDSKRGHGKNFHILEPAGTVVTLFVEMGSPCDGQPKEFRMWYTREDTGVTFSGGDGIDLSKYKKWIPWMS